MHCTCLCVFACVCVCALGCMHVYVTCTSECVVVCRALLFCDVPCPIPQIQQETCGTEAGLPRFGLPRLCHTG